MIGLYEVTYLGRKVNQHIENHMMNIPIKEEI